MNIRQVIVAFLVLASSTRAPLAARQQTAAPVPIPFELENHLVIVNARVNNSGPLAFIFDTGASAAIVRTETARNLGLSLQGKVNGRGAGAGVQVGSLVKNATWSLIGLERVSQPVAIALPLLALPSSLGRRIDGIIGGAITLNTLSQVRLPATCAASSYAAPYWLRLAENTRVPYPRYASITAIDSPNRVPDMSRTTGFENVALR